MATPKLSPYEKATRRAVKSYVRWATDTVGLSPLEERAQRHLQVVAHWNDPPDFAADCMCEGCSFWLVE